jgi:NAD(P)H dehydrogenase (quinone)
VYPVYWWSMPGLLKGWIDRVFTRGWAYDYGHEAGVVKKLTGRVVHLVGIGGSDAGTFERHGYAGAMKTQIDHGIFDYCGARVATSNLLLDAHTGDTAAHLETARLIGRGLLEEIDRRAAAGESSTVPA